MRSPAVALRPARGRWRREERLELLWQLGADPLQLVARDRLAQRVDYRTRVIERFGAGYALQLRDPLEQLGQGERLLPAARWARQVALGTKRQLVGKICRQALREAAAEGRQGCGKRPFGASAVQPACGQLLDLADQLLVAHAPSPPSAACQRERSPELAVRCARAPDRGGALRPGRGSCSWRLMLESSAESSLIVCSSPGPAGPCGGARALAQQCQHDPDVPGSQLQARALQIGADCRAPMDAERGRGGHG